MSDDVSSLGGSILVSMLQVMFIGLKLGNVITWSWWWVMSPLWISWAFALIVFIFLFAFFINWREMFTESFKRKL
jgi:hypothetical protein